MSPLKYTKKCNIKWIYKTNTCKHGCMRACAYVVLAGSFGFVPTNDAHKYSLAHCLLFRNLA